MIGFSACFSVFSGKSFWLWLATLCLPWLIFDFLIFPLLALLLCVEGFTFGCGLPRCVLCGKFQISLTSFLLFANCTEITSVHACCNTVTDVEKASLVLVNC